MRLIQVFREAGIDLLPLKGTALSLRLYGEPAVRSLRDLDLLVRTGDFARADRLLIEQGYHRTFPGFVPTERMKTAILSLCRHYTYVHGSRNIDLELHWCYSAWSREQLEDLWVHSRNVELRGTVMRHIEDGLLFLLLCEHGAEHRWFRMKWLSDVAMLMTCQDSSPREDLTAFVKDRKLEASAAQALLLAHWLYGIGPPEWLRVFASPDGRAVRLASIALEAILSAQEGPDPNSIRRNLQEWRYLCIQGKAPSLGHYLRKIALNPDDASFVPLPDSLFWLYYVLRPVLWCWRLCQLETVKGRRRGHGDP